MTNEIKPCPFCGTAMAVVTKDKFSHPGTVGDGKCLLAGKGYFWEHIDWWNTRIQSTADLQADRDAVIVKTAYDIALSHSNYGDGEGNKRAFAIAADLKKKLPPTNIVSTAVELQAEVERLRVALEIIATGAARSHDTFKEKLGDRSYPTWFATNELQMGLDSITGTARATLAQKEPVE